MIKKRKNLCYFLRSGIFLFLFFTLFYYISEVFFPKWEDIDNTKPGIETFYDQPKNSIDVLFFGTSSFRNGISPLTIWEETGYTSYLRATTGQHPLVTYFYIVESLKFQNPEVIVVDGISLFYDFDIDKNESSIRKSVDPLRMSLVKLHLIKDIIENSQNQSFISYIFPLIRYHNRWKQGLTSNDFEFYKIDYADRFRGQYITRGFIPYIMPDYFANKKFEDAEPYNSMSHYYFKKMISFCKDKGIELIFISLPRVDNYDHSKHLAIKNLAYAHDLQFIDYNMPELIEETRFDPLADFQNETHLNVYGSQRISKHFGFFLKEEFSLLDRRNDLNFENWNTDLQYYKSSIP